MYSEQLIEMETKTCADCGAEKPKGEISLKKKLCTVCLKNYQQKRVKEYREKTREENKKRCKEYKDVHKNELAAKRKVDYEQRKELLNERCRAHYENNKDEILKQKKQYQEQNQDKIKTQRQKYYQENKERLIKNNSARIKKYYDTDPSFRLAHLMRTRMRMALKGEIKTGKTFELLGCSTEELKRWLEMQFYDDKMSWDNYGSYWHVDHIIPCAHFDLTDPEQQKQCFHHTNLQPMIATENLSKGAKIMVEV